MRRDAIRRVIGSPSGGQVSLGRSSQRSCASTVAAASNATCRISASPAAAVRQFPRGNRSAHSQNRRSGGLHHGQLFYPSIPQSIRHHPAPVPPATEGCPVGRRGVEIVTNSSPQPRNIPVRAGKPLGCEAYGRGNGTLLQSRDRWRGKCGTRQAEQGSPFNLLGTDDEALVSEYENSGESAFDSKLRKAKTG